MPIFSRLIFTVVRWSARRGLRDAGEPAPQKQNQEEQRDEKFERQEKACRRGLLGETYGYWYLRRHGYVFIAKKLYAARRQGRAGSGGISGLPELSVSHAKQSVLVRTARRFLADRHLNDCPTCFDVLAIDNIPGHPPEMRLHKNTFSPQLRRSR
jgi:hypothetical protein